ncbi:hypothetical protein [Agrococcus sp. ProA11]|uniref:hypothetical protein n=1 Tax=Agrococcus chionoecetis TaxID=3153752 RepID=UPI0032616330
MTTPKPVSALEIERDFTEQRDWGIRFVMLAGLASWVLSGAFGSSGGGGGENGPSWSVVVQVMPAVEGAVVGVIALAWLATQWQRHDRQFVVRVQRLVLLTAWALVAIAIVGSYVALFWVDRPPSSPPVVFFPLEVVDAYR